MLETKHIKVELTLTKDCWGTVPQQTDIWHNFIKEKMTRELKKKDMTQEEIDQEIKDTAEGVEDLDQAKQGLTGFYRNPGKVPCLRDYQIKGFLKNSAKTQKQFGNLKQLNDKVTRYLFIKGDSGKDNEYITPDPIPKPEDEKTGLLPLACRPIRCETALGPRTSIARSEFFPAGTKLTFTIESLLGVFSLENIKSLLDYGAYAGIGQSRQNQQGTFTYKILAEK